MIKFATVLETNPDSLLVRDSSGQEILVYTRNARQFTPGDFVRIIYNGAMTLSLPPQISAIFVTLVRRGARVCGEILSLGRDSFVLRDADGAHFQVNWEDTYSLSAGDTVCVQYDGRMTRSIPPQITGIAVEQVQQTETICGEIQSIGAGFFLLLSDDAQEIRVNFPEAAGLMPEGRVCVQFNGVMTRSIPPQITAIAVEQVQQTETICGEIQSIGAGFFLLLSDDAQEIRVNFPEAASLTPGQEVCVEFSGAMTRSIPPQIAAVAVYPRRTEAQICGEIVAVERERFLLLDSAGMEIYVNTPAAREYAPGDLVCIVHNGVMTASIPPQIAAIEIIRQQ